ncbi:hypothetical protein [Stackebrandtia soli]|uniref:hypothetical protein n=1 Tax=Stackebrandtia soli TaxID=1892856 RepID=UPI0039E74613
MTVRPKRSLSVVVAVLAGALMVGCSSMTPGIDLGDRFVKSDIAFGDRCHEVAPEFGATDPIVSESAGESTFCSFDPIDMDGFFVYIDLSSGAYHDPLRDEWRRRIIEDSGDPTNECVLVAASADADAKGHEYVEVEDGSGYCLREIDDTSSPEASVDGRTSFFAHSYLINVDIRVEITPALRNSGDPMTRPIDDIRELHRNITMTLFDAYRS